MNEEVEPSLEAVAAALVAVLFVRAEPIPRDELVAALHLEPQEVDSAASRAADLLRGTGLLLQTNRGELQLVSHPDQAWAVERALRPEVSGRLSRPALETLAIVAYKQPVTRAAIEAIRGVNCEGVLDSLERHGLIAETGRAETPGRPRLFATTMRFLQVVGIGSLEELPPLVAQDAWMNRAAQLSGGA